METGVIRKITLNTITLLEMAKQPCLLCGYENHEISNENGSITLQTVLTFDPNYINYTEEQYIQLQELYNSLMDGNNSESEENYYGLYPYICLEENQPYDEIKEEYVEENSKINYYCGLCIGYSFDPYTKIDLKEYIRSKSRGDIFNMGQLECDNDKLKFAINKGKVTIENVIDKVGYMGDDELFEEYAFGVYKTLLKCFHNSYWS